MKLLLSNKYHIFVKITSSTRHQALLQNLWLSTLRIKYWFFLLWINCTNMKTFSFKAVFSVRLIITLFPPSFVFSEMFYYLCHTYAVLTLNSVGGYLRPVSNMKNMSYFLAVIMFAYNFSSFPAMTLQTLQSLCLDVEHCFICQQQNYFNLSNCLWQS